MPARPPAPRHDQPSGRPAGVSARPATPAGPHAPARTSQPRAQAASAAAPRALRPAPRRSRRRPARLLGGTLLFVAGVGAAGWGVAAWLGHLDAEPVVVRCSATADGTAWYLEPDQADTSALLAATSVRRGLPARATTIAIATGLQESKLRNIDYGDRDSLGIFQQRPSQGWGTPEQLLDPVYSTNAFYDALVEVAGYEDMAITEAAQAVQRSGFPDAYAQHEPRARAWASALNGFGPGTLACTLPSPDGPGDAGALTARVERDFGALPVTAGEGALDVDASGLGGPEAVERMGWIVAHWAVAVAQAHDVVEVHHAGSVWVRDAGAWEPADAGTAPAAGVVRIVLAR